MRTPGSSAAVTGERVMAAAARTFARHGYAATGIRQLAREAGLTPGALYHYMGSKEGLLVAIMRSTIEPIVTAANTLLRNAPRPEQALATLVELHVWLHGTRPDAALVADTEVRALHGEARDEILELRDRYEAIWRAVVDDGTAAGVFDVEDPRLATIALLGLSGQVSQWYTPEGRLTLEEVCAMHADLALGMVRARRGNRPVRRARLELASPSTVLGV
jgi:AcrR family transcriptional regulator